MINADNRYRQALASFSVPGNRWQNILTLTYWAVASNRSEEDVLHDVHANGIHDRDSDIRRGLNSAAAKIAEYTTIQKQLTPRTSYNSVGIDRHARAPSARVKQLIDHGKDFTDILALRTLSPKEICPDHDWLALRVQCEMQLLAYFERHETLHVFSPDAPQRGQPGINLRPLGEWLERQNNHHPDHAGEIVRPNPFTGLLGRTADGKGSFIAKDCLSAYRHMVFEFDHLSVEDQCRFWAGFIQSKALPLVSLVYSGNKSIHGVVRADAPDLTTWNRYRAQVLHLYGSDPDPRYRLDQQALHPLTGTRLAGIKRRSTGKIQELLWLA